MLCRVVRTHPKSSNQKKLFLKVSTRETARLTYFVMSFVVAMSNAKYYLYKRSKRWSLDIPVRQEFILNQHHQASHSREVSFPNLPDIQCFEEFNAGISGKTLRTYAYTNFKKVRSHLDIMLSSHGEHLALMDECNSRREFRIQHRRSYEYLLRFDRASLDNRWPPIEKRVYDIKAIIELAKTYPTRSAFREAHHGCFKYLARNNKLHLLPMEKKITRWNIKSAMQEAKKYPSKTQFIRKAAGAYQFLEREGLQYEVKALYKPIKTIQWNEKTLLKYILKCERLVDFKHAYPGGYGYLIRNGLYSKYAEILKGARCEIYAARDKSMVATRASDSE
jgi:hypothetical protein